MTIESTTSHDFPRHWLAIAITAVACVVAGCDDRSQQERCDELVEFFEARESQLHRSCNVDSDCSVVFVTPDRPIAARQHATETDSALRRAIATYESDCEAFVPFSGEVFAVCEELDEAEDDPLAPLFDAGGDDVDDVSGDGDEARDIIIPDDTEPAPDTTGEDTLDIGAEPDGAEDAGDGQEADAADGANDDEGSGATAPPADGVARVCVLRGDVPEPDDDLVPDASSDADIVIPDTATYCDCLTSGDCGEGVLCASCLCQTPCNRACLRASECGLLDELMLGGTQEACSRNCDARFAEPAVSGLADCLAESSCEVAATCGAE